MTLADLSNEDLLQGVHGLVGDGRRTLARLLAHLIEVERRELHLELAYSSLFDFCTRKLRMSEDEASRRIRVARLAAQFPLILQKLESGDVHLTGLLLLRDHLTDANHEKLLNAVAGKTKSEIQEFLAARFPQPDIPSAIRPLPEEQRPDRELRVDARSSTRADAAAAGGVDGLSRNTRAIIEPLAPSRYRVEFTASGELRAKIEHARAMMRHRNPNGDVAIVIEAAIDLLVAKLEKERYALTTRPRNARPKSHAGEATTETTAVDAHGEATTETTAVDAHGEATTETTAVDAHGEATTETTAVEVDADRPVGFVAREPVDRPFEPNGTGIHVPTEPARKKVPAAVRRAVLERDGHQCTFQDADGRRCRSRCFLEFDHIWPEALGGKATFDNIRILCRPHNRLVAEHRFGRAYIAQKIHTRQRGYSNARAKHGLLADVDVSNGNLELFAKAERALVGMGFREAHVRRVLGLRTARVHVPIPPLGVLLVDALGTLTTPPVP